MNAASAARYPGPQRDFVGYGQYPPDPTWPDGSKVAVNLVINYEEGAEYSLLDGDDHNDSWGEYTYEIPGSIRDLSTETHMEFGSRVGIWRLARLIDEQGIPCSIDACALALERNPEFSQWIRERTHDVIGHGYRWTEDSRMTRDEERTELRRAIASFQATTGQRVAGWIVRSFPSISTRELLVEEGGFLYDSDASNDELPYFVRPANAAEPFLVIPYSKVMNDVKYFVAPFLATPRDFFESLRDGLGYLLDEARRGYGGRLMTVGLHARWSGQANRAAAVRDFIEHVKATDGACFLRRVDVARHWIDHHETFPRVAPRPAPTGS